MSSSHESSSHEPLQRPVKSVAEPSIGTGRPSSSAADPGLSAATAPSPSAAQLSSAAPVRRLSWPLIVQFVKFGIVGVSNTLIAFAVYTVLLKGFGVWYILASGIGFVVGAVNGFLLNRRWTFREHVGDALTPVRWGIVQSCGLGLNLALVYLFVHDVGMDKLVGQIPATAIVVVLTFAANRAWTFRVHAPTADSPAADPI
jgi:putative flippase GtrA